MMRTAGGLRRGLWGLIGFVGALALAGCGGEPTATPAPAPGTPTLPPAATLTPAPAGPDAWTQVRSALPARVLVLRPTWLPEQFREAPTLAYADNSGPGPMYKVTYTSTDEDVLGFVLGAENTAPPESREAITVRGVPGQLFRTASSSPALWASWQEGTNTYQVLAYGAQNKLTREELLRIIGGLTPVP
jgi:hypothetical protein